ncbi:MAG: ADP-ribosylglycohydrolase family protein [Chloroflexi bacterium]|nr:ADP-ribosylglycohydrolase family protein [Chloroflexota bacterium]
MMRSDDEVRRAWELTTGTGVVVRPVAANIQALENRGRETAHARRLFEEGERLFAAGDWSGLRVQIARINAALRGGATRSSARLPSTLAEVRRSLPATPALRPVDEAELGDRLLAGWLGKVIGGALGTPVEGWTRDAIARVHGTVSDYLAAPTTINDDTAYQLVLLHAVEQHGPDVSSVEIGLEWLRRIRDAYTAEEIAIGNMEAGIMPPQSGAHENPYSHWIGGMMKGEICGWLAPGRPEVAIDLAHRDGVIAHETEGVYGELFTAATIATAFVEADPRALIRAGLAFVPPQSEFAAVARQAIAWCEAAQTWEDAWSRAEAALVPRYHWIHTFPNLAAVIVALWFGGGDFGRSIAIATMCGLDTDCTAGQVGALLATARGTPAISLQWREPIGDALESTVVGLERVPFDDLAQRTLAAARSFVARTADR